MSTTTAPPPTTATSVAATAAGSSVLSAQALRLNRRSTALLDSSVTKPKPVAIGTTGSTALALAAIPEVSLSSFAFLFSEIIQHYQNKVRGVRDLEKALSDHGKQVGSRLFEVLALRERSIKRETKVLNVLYFLQATVWKSLFGRAADSIEKSTSSEDEYMIIDADPLVTRYVNVPREMGGALSCAAFVAGIIEAIMTASLCPCVVTAHTVPIEGKRQPNRTVYLIKLDQEVMNREQQLK